jgi:hypothetical protein
MGRKPIHTYVPNEFGTLSKEERRIRGEMSTILRMKKRREEKILKLKEEISLIEKDIQKVDTKFKRLIKEMNTEGFQFPIFKVIFDSNNFTKIPIKEKGRFRVEYTINKKREKLDIGTFEYVMRRMIVVSPKFKNEYLEHSSEVHDELIMEVFRHDIQMMYWEKEYQRFVEGKRDWSKK